MTPSVIVHIDKAGNPQYRSTRGVDVYVVDERTPGDRVFQISEGALRGQFDIDEILDGYPVGHADDDRHEMLSRRVHEKAAAAGTLVSDIERLFENVVRETVNSGNDFDNETQIQAAIIAARRALALLVASARVHIK